MSSFLGGHSKIKFELFFGNWVARRIEIGRTTIGRLELPPGEGRFVWNHPTRSPPTYNGLYGRVFD